MFGHKAMDARDLKHQSLSDRQCPDHKLPPSTHQWRQSAVRSILQRSSALASVGLTEVGKVSLWYPPRA